MQALFETGHVVTLAIGLMLIEAAAIIWMRRNSAMHVVLTLAAAMLPGVFLLMALHAALTGAGWETVAVWLTASLPAHLFDLYRRLRQAP